MFTKTFVATLALASNVAAHTLMYSVWVNDEDQGDGQNQYIRSPPNNSPVKDLQDPSIVCNVNGGKAVSKFVSAAAGDKLSFEWYHASQNDDIIDLSHKGPIVTYVAPFTEGDGTGPNWSKIDEEGLGDDGKWAVDNLVANGGKKDFTLPSSLAAGKYLIRQEIIGLHEADVAFSENSARGAQFYPSCVQVEVTGSGSAVPDENFDFQTGYTSTDPGISAASGSGSGSGANPAPTTTQASPTTAAAPSPTTLVTSTKAAALTPTQATPQPGGNAGAVALYGQCGGNGYTGATSCAEGFCKVQNPYYSQCVSS
ncbi:glycosyl hydrolase family 61-domain-containing protein [Hypoxylon sp. FL1284]|nr:glycosyl hydrolase family 61-domain-containing protein [Hypoxylon sp. FL1284]